MHPGAPITEAADPATVAGDAAGADPEPDRCRADWRRPDAYWRCVREAGHSGRHRMRRVGG